MIPKQIYLRENIDKALKEKTPYNALSVDYKHKDIGFYCQQCGICCQYAYLMEPSLDRGDGTCIHLDEETRLCKVYDKRPLICNVGSLFKLHFKDIISKKEYLNDQYESCKYLIRQHSERTHNATIDNKAISD